MKKKVLALIFVLSLPSYIFADVVNVSHHMTDSGYSTTLLFSSEEAKILLGSSLDNNGQINFKAPFCFSFELRDVMKIGELRPDGIVLQMLEPFDTSSKISGFARNRFKRITTPSFESNYNGILIPFTNFEIYALKANNNGFGFSWGNRNAFISVLKLDNNFSQKESEGFLLDWKDFENQDKSLQFIAGVNSTTKIRCLNIQSLAFIRGNADSISGQTIRIGIDMKLASQGNSITYMKRLGTDGDKTVLSCKIQNAEINYEDFIHTETLYMGDSQTRETEYKISWKHKGFEITNAQKARHLESGKTSLSHDITLRFKMNGYLIWANTDTKSFSLGFSDPRCSFVFSGNEASLEYCFPFSLCENFSGKFTLNQKRQLSAAFRYSD